MTPLESIDIRLTVCADIRRQALNECDGDKHAGIMARIDTLLDQRLAITVYLAATPGRA